MISSVSICDLLADLRYEFAESEESRLNTERRGRLVNEIGTPPHADGNCVRWERWGDEVTVREYEDLRRVPVKSYETTWDAIPKVCYFSDWTWQEHGLAIVEKHRAQLEEFGKSPLDGVLFAEACRELQDHRKQQGQPPLSLSRFGVQDADMALSIHHMLQVLVRRVLKCFDQQEPMQALNTLWLSRSLRTERKCEWFPTKDVNGNYAFGIEDLKPLLEAEATLADAILLRHGNQPASGATHSSTIIVLPTSESGTTKSPPKPDSSSEAVETTDDPRATHPKTTKTRRNDSTPTQYFTDWFFDNYGRDKATWQAERGSISEAIRIGLKEYKKQFKNRGEINEESARQSINYELRTPRDESH